MKLSHDWLLLWMCYFCFLFSFSLFFFLHRIYINIMTEKHFDGHSITVHYWYFFRLIHRRVNGKTQWMPFHGWLCHWMGGPLFGKDGGRAPRVPTYTVGVYIIYNIYIYTDNVRHHQWTNQVWKEILLIGIWVTSRT